jgi:hypothetical protein
LSLCKRLEFGGIVAYPRRDARNLTQGGPTMLIITPRAARVSMPIPIMFRRSGEEDWLAGKVVNLSESGVLFGPTELRPGTQVEVLLSPPVQVGTFATGKQVCAAQVVRATDVGVTAVRFDECRFLLE